MRRWSPVFAVALVVTLPSVVGCGRTTEHESAVAALVAQVDAAPTPLLDWATCQEPELARYQCATARVPLDYARPDGETIGVAVLRQPATDQDRRIGTVFAAAGGPGASGFDLAERGVLFPGEVSRRFDVVTFDQRGVGRSAPVECFADAETQRAFWSARSIPPATPEEEAANARAARELGPGCAANTGALLDHLTTVDAARDLDLLRRAVDDPLLTYQGAGYLGIVYGALFGDRVRAMQLGSLVDPESYTRDTRAMMADTAVATEEVRAEFLRLCAAAGRSSCDFARSPGLIDLARDSAAPTATDLRERDDALVHRARRGPITVGAGERTATVSYAELVRAHAVLLSDSEDGWPALGRLLHELERGAEGDSAVVREILTTSAVDADFLDSFTAISCADHTLPDQPEAWPAMASEIERAAPVFGAFWLYTRQPCASWPMRAGGFPQRYSGPWTLGADKPALLFGNRFDPVTPLLFAQRAQQAMVNARLVTVTDGYGNDRIDECTTHLRERYLVDLQLPAPGATCAADRLPFSS
ncbi:alpha/beta hydrolase [Nocardia bovistercoris]|uniref:alpha/beta hydrolase n=1 Tax=Nocardia bovistercoris TaxID=2785916 RepID=UPI002FCD00FA